ncbi:MAG: hypothetical protein HRU15_11285 [Planctomycetes bacterium]|nr:hypothetical protein [Planctomycetota bacterium]
MNGTQIMLWRLMRTAKHGLRRFLVDEPLQGIAFFCVVMIVWLIMIGLMRQALIYLSLEAFITFKPRLVETVLALFFFALFFLMIISDMVVAWTALYRSESAIYQSQLPLNNRALFWNAYTEGGLWSGWALLVLAIPIVIVLRHEAAEPYYFMPAAMVTFFCFFFCCMSTGSLCAILLGRIIPYMRRGIRGIAIIVVGIIAFGAFLMLGALEERGRPRTFMREVIGNLSFTENPLVPPSWAQQAISSASLSRWHDWLYFIGLMIAFSIMISLIAEHLAQRRLRIDIDRLLGRPDQKQHNRSKAWRPLPFFDSQVGMLIAKDFRLFIRDPAQVMQFAMFFGLLSLYIIMLPRISQTFAFSDTWRPVVSLLNLAAVSMAMATFTGRFVYPMLSLEGKRLWVLMLAPWQPERIITSKYIFACITSIPISVILVASSGYMLDLDLRTICYEAYVTICIGLGLSASALGTGARLADYREDNPAKLVAGYGGTINLLASITFCGFSLAGASLPIVRGNLPGTWAIGIIWITIISVIWICYGLVMANTWFTRRVWQCSAEQHKKATMPSRRRNAIFVSKTAFYCIMMYIFSYGPAVFLWKSAEWPAYSLKYFYQPVIWMQDSSFLGPAINWYVELF